MLSLHPVLTFWFGHLFDGVAEGRARHLVGMLAEEVAQEVHPYPFAHLAQHPADCLVHEVVGMMEMNLGIAQAPRGIAHLRGLPRTDDTHALFPEAGALGQFV